MLRFNKPTLITLTAPTASGKNYLRDRLEKEFGFQRIVSTTTRAMRSGEVEGEDYYFISEEESKRIEVADEFAELITFRGVRYGVTKKEMEGKMTSGIPPLLISEPNGVAIYKKICLENGWDIFSVYIHATEELRLQRLAERSAQDIFSYVRQNLAEISKSLTDQFQAIDKIEKLINIHTDRVLSITGEERHWSNTQLWDAIVPGDDANKAVEMIKHGIEYRNRKNSEPVATAA